MIEFFGWNLKIEDFVEVQPYPGPVVLLGKPNSFCGCRLFTHPKFVSVLIKLIQALPK